MTYIVKKGDTLWRIANKYNKNVNILHWWNLSEIGEDANHIEVGMLIKIPKWYQTRAAIKRYVNYEEASYKSEDDLNRIYSAQDILMQFDFSIFLGVIFLLFAAAAFYALAIMVGMLF